MVQSSGGSFQLVLRQLPIDLPVLCKVAAQLTGTLGGGGIEEQAFDLVGMLLEQRLDGLPTANPDLLGFFRMTWLHDMTSPMRVNSSRL